MNVSNSNFLPLLKRLDECISYVESNPQYAESSVYLLKFRQLQSRALGMIRTYILAVLRTAASQVQAAFPRDRWKTKHLSRRVLNRLLYMFASRLLQVRFIRQIQELCP